MLLDRVKNILLAIPLTLWAGACSTIDYVDSSTFTSYTLPKSDDSHMTYITKGDNGGMNGLAFVLKGDDNTATGEDGDTAFFLKKKKSRYMVETVLFDSKDDDNSYFEKSFFSFGADRKKKSVGVELRFVY